MQLVGRAGIEDLNGLRFKSEHLPEGIQNVLQTENGAIGKSEHHAGNAQSGHDLSEILPFGLGRQNNAQKPQNKALTQIAEHDAEHQGVGNGHKEGGVKVVVTGSAVHFHEHLERAGEPAVFQLGGRS